MEGGDDLFVINDVEAEQAEEVPEARPAEQAPETEAEVMESVKGLVPLCTQHVQGPQLSGATFGYDIAQMAKRPWAEPGAKLSDYFNYGFNEKSWRVYCAMQENGEASLLAQATAMLQKLEHAGRSADEAAAGAGGAAAAGRDEPPMMAMGGPAVDGYGGGPGPYGGPDGPGRGGGYGRPYGGRDFHGGFDRPPNANYKTRMCKSFAEGHCHRGEHCNFAHSAAELRQPGGGGGGGGGAPPQQHPHPQSQLPGPAGGAPPAMGPGPGYGDRRQGFNNFYAGPPPSSQPGMQGGMGGAPPPQQQQPQQQPQMPERANYLMPPFQAGAGMPPMMGPTMSMQGGREGGREGGGGGGGFRQPPKRQRHEGGGVYEPQY